MRDHGAGRAISDIDPSELEEVYWTRLVRWIDRAQQDWLRRTCPRWFGDTGEPLNPNLRLFPKSVNNRDGTVPLNGSVINSWIRAWVGKGEKGHTGIQQTPTIVWPDGAAFPCCGSPPTR